MAKTKKDILVIDDDPQTLFLINNILSAEGFNVSEATTIETALQQIQYDPPHLIILDLVLGKQNGFDYLKQYHHQHELSKRTPVIVLTGLQTREALSTAISLGVSDFIVKPFAASTLLHKVYKVFRGEKLLRVKIEEGAASQAKMISLGRIIQNETGGLVIEVPVKVAENKRVSIASDFLVKIKCDQCLFQRTNHPARLIGSIAGQFLNEFTIVGISPETIELIKMDDEKKKDGEK